MIWPNQPLVWDAYNRLGSAGEPFTWYISQPAKCGPLTSHLSRLPSADRMNAPFFVPTSTRTPLIRRSFLLVVAARTYKTGLRYTCLFRYTRSHGRRKDHG